MFCKFKFFISAATLSLAFLPMMAMAGMNDDDDDSNSNNQPKKARNSQNKETYAFQPWHEASNKNSSTSYYSKGTQIYPGSDDYITGHVAYNEEGYPTYRSSPSNGYYFKEYSANNMSQRADSGPYPDNRPYSYSQEYGPNQQTDGMYFNTR